MSKKVILMSIDGMRPDGLLKCGNPFVEEMMRRGQYTLTGRTVYPSVTLPCHVSMFYSVPPERHGTVTNVYVPQVHPMDGLTTVIKHAHKKSVMFYGWEQIRAVAPAGDMAQTEFYRARAFDDTDNYLIDKGLECIAKVQPDFAFLYQVETDEKGGHDHGWMSEEYLAILSNAVSNVKKVLDACGDEYTVFVTADHGGHDRAHGTDMPEDMTIPMFGFGPDFTPGATFEDASILDITPTIAKIMELPFDENWEGKPLV